jgi:hypothetical protein
MRDLDGGFELFQSLRDVVACEDVRMSGAWVATQQRRYASPAQAGTGEGPYTDVTDWRWDGVFESASPLAGIALLSVGERLYWVKSHPPTLRPKVSVFMSGRASRSSSVSASGSFHGAFLPSVPVETDGEPPASCEVASAVARTGVPYVVAQLQEVVFAVLLLPASMIKVGRNRLWRLRENIALPLRPDLRRLVTSRRTGVVGR